MSNGQNKCCLCGGELTAPERTCLDKHQKKYAHRICNDEYLAQLGIKNPQTKIIQMKAKHCGGVRSEI